MCIRDRPWLIASPPAFDRYTASPGQLSVVSRCGSLVVFRRILLTYYSAACFRRRAVFPGQLPIDSRCARTDHIFHHLVLSTARLLSTSKRPHRASYLTVRGVAVWLHSEEFYLRIIRPPVVVGERSSQACCRPIRGVPGQITSFITLSY